jgi:F0F1-type ATP synthase assembly protein I
MWMPIIKILVSASVIALVTEIAKRSPVAGGWIAALPLVSLISAVWLAVDQKSGREIADFLRGVVWGLIPTAIMLIVIIFGLRYRLPFVTAALLGMAIWGAYTWTVHRLGV